jgi:hypothetical protein
VQAVITSLMARLRTGLLFLSAEKKGMMVVHNGIPADQLVSARWRKSQASNPSGSCVQVAELADGAIAMRNSRHPSRPALIYTEPRSRRSWPG